MTDPETFSFAGDFAPATYDDWRKLVASVLKGAPFERLESRTYDGLTIKPLYERAVAARAVAGRIPDAAWSVMQRIDHPDPAAANAQALEDLHNGATGLVLVFAGTPTANGFGLEPSAASLARVLDGVRPDSGVAIEFDLSEASRHVVDLFAEWLERRGVAPSSVKLRAGFNPIGTFAATGRAPRSWIEMAPDVASAVGRLVDADFRGPFVAADARVVHDAGGSEAQELAYALASAVAYLRALEAHGLPLELARDAIYFRLSADADQFLTMAKFRALRKLWARVGAVCGLVPTPALITAETAWRIMSRRDAYSNMLRTTIAVAAAGLGGADTIIVLPYTAALGLPDAFARRIARNTQLVLLEESNLARVADPAAGAGALETLTNDLCGAGWSLFQEIESAGGIWPTLATGMLQQKIAAVRAERQKAIARRKDILTGTSDYPNINETQPAILDVAPRTAPAPARDRAGAVSAQALPRPRLAEPFERLRDASDRMMATTGARPKIFLANLGTPADFNSRTTFAKNFFEAGGLEAVSDESADRPPLAAAFKASGAALACLCSSDKVYEKEAAAAAQTLKAAGVRHLYLAGRPGEREGALQAAGVQSFICDGCDALAILEEAYGAAGLRT
jgi:methylmalonyl-CoA mutase